MEALIVVKTKSRASLSDIQLDLLDESNFKRGITVRIFFRFPAGSDHVFHRHLLLHPGNQELLLRPLHRNERRDRTVRRHHGQRLHHLHRLLRGLLRHLPDHRMLPVR